MDQPFSPVAGRYGGGRQGMAARSRFGGMGGFRGRNAGGLIRRYQEGGLAGAPEMMDSMGMGPPPMGPPPMGPPPMGPPPMGMEEEVFPGMSNSDLAQAASSMEPEEIEKLVEEVKMALQGRHPNSEQILAIVDVMFPGMIEQIAVSMEGTGDGMTDSQMALLAPGEYVVDSRTVSDLGNGSSDAGGQAMDKMVQEIRMANTGTPEQLPGMDPEEFFPMG